MTTTFDPSTPDHVISIATSAILVSVEVRGKTGSKRSHELSDELTTSKNADHDTAEVTKKLFSGCPEHKALSNFRQTVANGMRVMTYDWAGSLRLLPMVRYAKFKETYAKWETEHERLKREFLQVYPDMVNNAAYKLQDMFDRNDYPTVGELERAFTISLYECEVPTGDFRVHVSEELAQDLRTHYTKQARSYVDEVMNTQVDQFLKVMEQIRHCCGFDTKTKDNGEIVVTRRKLYEGTIEKALEMCETFKQFNPGSNSRLDEARIALAAALDGIDPKSLRNSDTKRTELSEEVDDIIKKFRI